MAKGRATQRQATALRRRDERAAELRSWMQDCLTAFKQRRKAKMTEPERVRAGVTAQMRAIRGPEPQWVHEHTGPPGHNVPYVNPARDLKPGRRLRSPEAGRKNKPPTQKPQKPKRPKGGSK